MDKYEFNIKVEQLKKLVSKNDFETAMKIADTIDWRRVRNTNLLSMVAMVYEKNEDYEEAREILLLAYERAPIGKRLLYKLAELAVKEGNIGEAEAYYREFTDLAPDDPRQQLLRYMILKAKGAPAQQLIHSLESYTGEELDEQWLYELAELYSLAGMADRCVETCDKIMLMFGLGKYVEKAMELKLSYAPLTTYQMDLVENRDKYEAKLRAVEEEYRMGSRMNGQAPAEEYYAEGNDGGYAGDGYANDGYADGGYASDGYANDGYADGGYANDGYADGGYAADGYANDGYADGGYAADGYANDGYADGGYAADGYVNDGYANDGYAGDPYTADGYASAAPAAGYDEGSYTGEASVDDGYMAETGAAGGYGEAGYEPGIYAEDGEEEDGDTLSIEAVDHWNEETYPEAHSIDEELKARMQEAQVQEDLAKELSKIADQGPDPDLRREPEKSGNTRVLDDIRRVRRPAAAGTPPAVRRGAKAAAGIAGMAAETGTGAAAETAALAGGMAAAEAAAAVTGAAASAAESVLHPETELPAESSETVRRPKQEDISQVKKEIPDQELDILDMEEDGEADQKPLNHLMIEARNPVKGLEMAVEALKQIHKETGVRNPVAKITGARLSRRGVLASADKLAGKDLVIEEAGDLTEEALGELNELMNRDTTGMIVVLIDNPKQMESLHLGHPVLAGKFECIGCGEPSLTPGIAEPEPIPMHPGEEKPVAEVVRPATFAAAPSEEEEADETDPQEDMPEEDPTPKKDKKGGFFNRKKPVYEEMEPEEGYGDEYYEVSEDHSVRDEAGPGSRGEEMDIDEFAQYACKYAAEIDCSITGKSMLALYERIEILEEDGVPLTRRNAEELIEEAADRAEKPSFGKRIKGLFSSKYDKDGLLILKEEHFIY